MLLNPREYTKSRLNPEWADRLLVDEFESITPADFLAYLIALGIPARRKLRPISSTVKKQNSIKSRGSRGGGKDGGEMVARVAEAIRCYFFPQGK